jgi:DNA-3-methyladenine glycosylase II
MINAETISAAEAHLRRRDRKIGKLIDRHGPCALGGKRRDPFHVLSNSIISQQLSVKAADTILGRVRITVGAKGGLKPQHLLAVTQEQLRACGLSNAKAKWLKALAELTHSGEFSFARLHKLDDEAAIEALDALPGIGRWTAEMMLIFALDRPDVFSLGDVGLRRAMNQLYNRGEALDDESTLAITERWAPYRSVASWYLWRAID